MYSMRTSVFSLILVFFITPASFAQNAAIEQDIKELSKAKWQWMADKDVDLSLIHI